MNLIERAKNIIAKPKVEWDVIATEDTSLKNLITSYVIPFALISAIATFIGFGFIGKDTILFGRIASVKAGIAEGILVLVAAILSVIILAYIIDFLAPNFGSEKNINKSAQLVAYSNTPVWIASILNIYPSMLLAVISLAASIYGIYVWYLGLGPLKKTPEDKKVTYIIVSILVIILAYFLIALILGPIIYSLFGITKISGI